MIVDLSIMISTHRWQYFLLLVYFKLLDEIIHCMSQLFQLVGSLLLIWMCEVNHLSNLFIPVMPHESRVNECRKYMLFRPVHAVLRFFHNPREKRHSNVNPTGFQTTGFQNLKIPFAVLLKYCNIFH